MKQLIILVVCFLLIGCGTGHQKEIDITKVPADVIAEHKLSIMPFLMVGGVVVSIFALLNGSKMGYAGVIACLVGLTLSLAVVKYANYLAIGGLVGAIGALVASLFNKQVGIVLRKVKKEVCNN
jgi:hypothetical protein